jgi:uncharacterized protein with FMN-binding domain
MRARPSATRRNLSVAGATAAGVGLLLLYPTSTHSRTDHRRPGQPLAPAGVVRPRGAASPAASATTLVNGTSAQTRYGPVQVQLAVRNGRIVRATAIDYPQGSGRDREINSFAIPVLERQTLTAQSAQVDTVSGATYTSDGYRRSLQAAIDLAHLR